MRKITFISLGLLAVFGCRPSEHLEPGVYANTNVVRYIKDMAPDCVLLRVNGQSITKADFTAIQRVNEKIYRLSNNIQLWKADRRASNWTYNNEQRVAETLLERELMRQEADRRGVVAASNRLQKVYKEYLRHMKCEDQKIEEVAEQFGREDGDLFLKMLADDVRFDMVREAESTNGVIEVSDAVVDTCLQRVKEFNANADKLTEKSKAKARKFRAEVLAGGDFTELTKKYADLMPEHGEKWNDFAVSDIPDDWELKKWLQTAKGGDVSEPMDTPDGIAVVGLIFQYTPNLPKELRMSGAPEVENRLVKCTFNAYEKLSESRDDITRDLMAKQRRQQQKRLGERLFREAVIEYPNGVTWFPPYAAPKPPEGKGFGQSKGGMK